jgi:hypothetical protein
MERLTSTERAILELMVSSERPISRKDMERIGVRHNRSKLLGASGKPNKGGLEGRGLIKSFRKGPEFFYTITDNGRAALKGSKAVPTKKVKPRGTSVPRDLGRSYLPADQGLPGLPVYSLTDDDQRKTVDRQIKERRGQSKFRNALRTRYGDACVITGCKMLDLLEAAHIRPYRGPQDHHPANGLLLRADIHTLFDLDLIGIEPANLIVRVHTTVKDATYRAFHGKRLALGTNRPSADALQWRWERFQSR